MSHKLHTLLLIAIGLLGTTCASAQSAARYHAPSPYTRQQLAQRDTTTDKRTLYDRYLDNQEKKGRHIERIPREDLRATFIPKGQWMAGGSIAFNEWDGDNLNYLVLKNIDFEGHTFGVSPYVGYFVANNTAIGGRFKISDTELSEQSWTSIYASPEVASLDISNYCSVMKLPKREPPLFGRDEDVMREWVYTISQTEVLRTLDLMEQYDVKPEFECFAMQDLLYVKRTMDAGYKDPKGGPINIQFVYTGGSNWPTMDYMVAVKNAVPKGCNLGIIAAGAQQFPLLAMAIVQGFHVRVGMEDNVYMEKGVLAKSNAELVEKIVQIAKLLGRRIATPAEAREILGLGAPRNWD